MRALLILFLVSLSFAQVDTGAGNVSEVNVSFVNATIWYGLAGQTSGAIPPSLTVTAVPDEVEELQISTGSDSCIPDTLYILFSNSSAAITSLERGNLTILDSFINDPAQDGSATFGLSDSFDTSFGIITGVPTTYTNALVPTSFRMGYMQDQDGNMVFITDVVQNEVGFDGTLYDYQVILPTNGSNITYYVSVDLTCLPPQEEPRERPRSTGGGGSGIPIPQPETEEPVPVPPGNETIPPECVIDLICGDWGTCDSDGFMYQTCTDLNNCTSIDVINVEKCQPPEIVENETEVVVPIEPEKPVLKQDEPPCLLAVVILAFVIAILWYYRKKRREKK